MKRCTLCGGKLDGQKRCTLCGLDNTKNDSMYKHMINKNDCADEPLTHVHEEPAPRRQSVPVQKNNTYGTPKYESKSMPKNVKMSTQKSHTTGKKQAGCATVIGIIPFIIAIIGFLVNIAGDIFGNFSEAVPEPEYSYTEEYDPYEWVVDEMPEYGDSFAATFGPGIYEVGYHLPMGTYLIEAVPEFAGMVEVYDEWNEIYFSEYVYENYSMEDVMLFDGAYLVVQSGNHVSVYTENAQPMTITGTNSTSQEAIELSGQLVAGVDFEPGAYNIIYVPEEDAESFVEVIVFADACDYGFHITFESYLGEGTFLNVPLPEDAIIEVDEGYLDGVESIYMIPSVGTSDTDLESFYYAY